MKPHHVGLVILSVLLLTVESGLLSADEASQNGNSGKATSSGETGGLAGVRKLLATDALWTRLYTYDANVQVTVGAGVKTGKVISRVAKLAVDPMTYLLFEPTNFNGSGVLWIDGTGLSHLRVPDRKPNDVQPSPAVRSLLDSDYVVVSVDLPSMPKLPAGPSPVAQPRAEDSLLALQVRATLAAIAASLPHVTQLDVVGTGDAGPALLIASAFLSELPPADRKKIRHVIADLRGANAETTAKPEHPFFLPGANEVGGVPGMAALNGTQKLMLAGTKSFPAAELEVLKKSFEDSQNSDSLRLIAEPLTDELLVDLVIGKSQE